MSSADGRYWNGHQWKQLPADGQPSDGDATNAELAAGVEAPTIEPVATPVEIPVIVEPIATPVEIPVVVEPIAAPVEIPAIVEPITVPVELPVIVPPSSAPSDLPVIALPSAAVTIATHAEYGDALTAAIGEAAKADGP